MHWTRTATQKPGFLRGSRTTLECYDDGKLVNHGSIKLRLQHYSEGSFQDHSFYVVETRTPKPIIVGHPASIRLGLIKVLCKNMSKSVLAIEKTTKDSTRNSLSRPSTTDRRQKPHGEDREASLRHQQTPFKTIQRKVVTSMEKRQVKVSFQDHPLNASKINPNLATRP